MNIWHDLDSKRISPEEFIVCIEISKNSKMKYELDKETGRLILDRVLFTSTHYLDKDTGFIILDRILYTSTHYPANYGFIPKTYAGDNDPLDVLVLCQSEIIPLCLVKCQPIGVIKMIDNDMSDEKIIAVCQNDPSMNCYKDISELPPHNFEEIKHFFNVYKTLEGKEAMVTEVLGAEDARKIIQESIDEYKRLFE